MVFCFGDSFVFWSEVNILDYILLFDCRTHFFALRCGCCSLVIMNVYKFSSQHSTFKMVDMLVAPGKSLLRADDIIITTGSATIPT